MLAIYIVGKIINGHTLSSHIIFSFHFINKGAMFNTPETSLSPSLFHLYLNCISHAKSGFSEEYLDCQNCCL